ncbi:hypothetical protein ON010_g10560 [Phytophthora cinnamomi]|nr:hypothetical protein ON010_g10560 [Phytophthora cinnamomi]
MSVCDEVVLQFVRGLARVIRNQSGGGDLLQRLGFDVPKNGKAPTDGQEITLIKNLVFGYLGVVAVRSLWENFHDVKFFALLTACTGVAFVVTAEFCCLWLADATRGADPAVAVHAGATELAGALAPVDGGGALLDAVHELLVLQLGGLLVGLPGRHAGRRRREPGVGARPPRRRRRHAHREARVRLLGGASAGRPVHGAGRATGEGSARAGVDLARSGGRGHEHVRKLRRVKRPIDAHGAESQSQIGLEAAMQRMMAAVTVATGRTGAAHACRPQ